MSFARWIVLCSVALFTTACGNPATPGADAGAQDLGNRTDIVSPSAASTDATVDTATDAVSADDLPACVAPQWDGSFADAGPQVTSVTRLLTNCHHNENTDLLTWNGAIYLIHRTAASQVLTPDARLHLYRSTDGGQSFVEIHQFSYPGRDIRDPKLVAFGGELRVYSLSRLPGFLPYDLGTDALTTVARSPDGMTWTDPTPVYTDGWSFWREVAFNGILYAAAYQDGDQSIIFLSSADGITWTRLATVFDEPCHITLEPEPIFFPDGRVVVGIRMDDGPDYLDDGHEKLCYADPPYTSFQCPVTLAGRLDGPRTFTHGTDLWVIAREHLPLPPLLRKRTVLYRVTGNLHDLTGVGLTLTATFPSAGDTSYAGLTWLTPDRALVSYYTSDPAEDIPWWQGSLGNTDIFLSTLDFTQSVTGDPNALVDRGVNPLCRPLEDGGMPWPDAATDATSGVE